MENASGALGLYERLGFRTDLRFLVMERPLEASEAAPGPAA